MTIDLSAQKKIAISGRNDLSVRWDMFNLTNRANFGLPNRDVSNRTVGTITSLAGDARIMQFSARITF